MAAKLFLSNELGHTVGNRLAGTAGQLPTPARRDFHNVNFLAFDKGGEVSFWRKLDIGFIDRAVGQFLELTPQRQMIDVTA